MKNAYICEFDKQYSNIYCVSGLFSILVRPSSFTRKMNVELSNAVLTDGNGHKVNFSNFHVMGRRIRYVHIPEQVIHMSGVLSSILLCSCLSGRVDSQTSEVCGCYIMFSMEDSLVVPLRYRSSRLGALLQATEVEPEGVMR